MLQAVIGLLGEITDFGHADSRCRMLSCKMLALVRFLRKKSRRDEDTLCDDSLRRKYIGLSLMPLDDMVLAH